MLDDLYKIENTNEIITPNLIYYKDIIISNTDKAIKSAGRANRLWPHIKTHKMIEMIKLQQQLGINKFKCATIAEAEVVAMCEAEDILIAYPLIGPNIERLLALQKKANKSRLWAIGDNYNQLEVLSYKSIEHEVKTHVLIDVNLGMDRTGCAVDQIEELYKICYKLEGLSVDGLHCYDGHHNNMNIVLRKREVAESIAMINNVKQSLEKDGFSCSTIIAGGTPSFPCYVEYSDFYVSPGTLFVSDFGSLKNLPDMNYVPAAAIMTRVVSHPNKNLFTIDLGYKGIASDPDGLRGVIVGFEKEASPLFQSEEHWVFQMNEGYKDCRPEIGTVLYVIPTHICPTSALYPEALVSQDGKIIDVWQVTARNRKITI